MFAGKSTQLRQSLALWKKWYKTAKPFARGSYARVFNKRKTRYPQNALTEKGTIVRVTTLSSPLDARMRFYELKIIHALFPKNTPTVRAVQSNVDFEEVHMEEIPVHPELQAYMSSITKRKSADFRMHSKEYLRNKRVVERHMDQIKRVQDAMGATGIYGFDENPLNVSLANPKEPVFFEPKVVSLERLKKAMRKRPPAERKKLLYWLKQANNTK